MPLNGRRSNSIRPAALKIFVHIELSLLIVSQRRYIWLASKLCQLRTVKGTEGESWVSYSNSHASVAFERTSFEHYSSIGFENSHACRGHAGAHWSSRFGSLASKPSSQGWYKGRKRNSMQAFSRGIGCAYLSACTATAAPPRHRCPPDGSSWAAHLVSACGLIVQV